MAKAWWEGWERENKRVKLVGGMAKAEQRREASGKNGKVRTTEGSWWEGWERENNGGKLVGGMGKGEKRREAGGRNG